MLLRLLLPWGSRLSLLDGEAEPPRAAVLSDAPAEGLWLPEGVDAPAAGSVAPDVGAADGAQDGAEREREKAPPGTPCSLRSGWAGRRRASPGFPGPTAAMRGGCCAARSPPGRRRLALLGAPRGGGGRAALLYSAQAETPMLLGLLRPCIILPAGTGAERLEHILRHELTHLARRDLGYKWLAVFVHLAALVQPLHAPHKAGDRRRLRAGL